MSKKILTLGAFAIVFVIAAQFLTRPAVGAGGAGAVPGYSTDVQITKSAKAVDAYAIRVQVRDLATGNLIAAPQILAKAGSSSEAEAELAEHLGCQVKATVDPASKSATYSVTITQAGATVAEHTATVTIE